MYRDLKITIHRDINITMHSDIIVTINRKWLTSCMYDVMMKTAYAIVRSIFHSQLPKMWFIEEDNTNLICRTDCIKDVELYYRWPIIHNPIRRFVY